MFKKLLIFIKSFFRGTNLLKEATETKDNTNIENFKKEIKFNDGKELIKEILDEKNNSPKTQEEMNMTQEKLVDYIDVLSKKIDKCQTDIAIKQAELRKINN